MTDHLLEAYRADFTTRTDPVTGSDGQVAEGHVVNAHEVKPGIVYRDAKVTVTAFTTEHAMESYGYRFDTPDHRIVISGDTNPAQETIDASAAATSSSTKRRRPRRSPSGRQRSSASRPSTTRRRRRSPTSRRRRSRSCWCSTTPPLR